MKIDLRPAESDDFERLLALKETSYRAHVEALWGPWDPADQRQRFLEGFRDPAVCVVEVDGEFAGTLTVHEDSDPVALANIELEPAMQGRGIGTWLIGEVIARARANDRDVVLRVLRPNPAQTYYARLGFCVQAQTDTHVHMRWSGDAEARRALKLAREPWTDPGRRDGWLHDVFADEALPWVQWLQFVARRAGLGEAGRLLEIGCETGRRLAALSRDGWTVCGTEADPALRKAAARRLQRVADNAVVGARTSDVPTDDSFDVVACLGSAWSRTIQTEARAAVAAWVYAHLRPGGVLAIAGDNWPFRLRNYVEPVPITRSVLDVEVSQIRDDTFDYHAAVMRQRDTRVVERRGETIATATHERSFALLSVPDVTAQLRAAGLSDIETFTDLDRTSRGRCIGRRMLIIARR